MDDHGSHVGSTTAAVSEHGYTADIPGPHEGPHGYTSDKDAYLKRMRRIEGQVRGIAKMIDKDAYCIDVLTQVSAVTKALQAVSLGLVEDHLGHCVVEAARVGDEEASVKVREASDAIARLVRM